ncbi:MAG: PAS domain S-box protein [Deltaproteobacteria bacterium]|nr:PAS domain S-box protein [Deltaproteobacteria bacterium]
MQANESRQQREQSFLYRLAHDLARSTDTETIAEHLFAQARQLLGIEYGSLYLANDAGTELQGISAYGMDVEAFRQERIDLQREFAPVVQAFRQQRPIVSSDWLSDPQVSLRFREQYAFFRSAWIVPLLNGEKVVGALGLGFAIPRQATADEIRLLQILGDEAALALERARLTEALRASEERYRDLFENANDIIYTHDLAGNFTSLNSTGERLLGYSHAEALSLNVLQLLPPEYFPLAHEILEKRLVGHTAPTYAVEMVAKDGRKIPVEVNARLLYRQGAPVGYQGIARDVTERRRAETRQRENAMASAALAQMGQGLLSSFGTPTTLDRLCRLTAKSLEAAYSHTILWEPTEETYRIVAASEGTSEQLGEQRVFKLPRQRLARLFARLAQEGIVTQTMEALRDSIGQRVLQRFQIATVLHIPLRRGSDIIGVLSVWYRQGQRIQPHHRRIAMGIAQMASLVLANVKLIEELERANRLKQEFLGSVSHELRTPLNIIMGYHEMLSEESFGALTPDQTRILDRVGKSARELLDLVNATLDLSRLQNRRDVTTWQRIFLPAFFEELALDIQPLKQNPAVKILWRSTASLPSLLTNPIKLRMIMKNLLANALKFTEAGKITISAKREGAGISISVRDTGIGIPPDSLPSIFEPFRQVPPSSLLKAKGVGLGLYIVRQLVETLGGTVSAVSAVGKGSTFQVWLPLRQEPLRSATEISQRVESLS